MHEKYEVIKNLKCYLNIQQWSLRNFHVPGWLGHPPLLLINCPNVQDLIIFPQHPSVHQKSDKPRNLISSFLPRRLLLEHTLCWWSYWIKAGIFHLPPASSIWNVKINNIMTHAFVFDKIYPPYLCEVKFHIKNHFPCKSSNFTVSKNQWKNSSFIRAQHENSESFNMHVLVSLYTTYITT